MEEIAGCTAYSPAETAEGMNWGAEATGGAYQCLLGAGPPGAPGPPVHIHPTTDEAFYVGAGEATFRLGDEEHVAGPGSLVFVPRGTPHTVWNAGTVELRGIIVISPGDVEHEFVPVEEG
jgi:mannose-6-phosphate isomerase-like protein (cupin superfamily)